MVGVDHAVGGDLFLDERQQRGGFRILDDGGEYPAFSFQQAKNHHLSGRTSPAFAFPNSAKIAFVGLDLSGQLVAWKFAGNQLSEAQEMICRRVTVDSGDLGRRPSRAPSNEELHEFPSLSGTQTAFPAIHGFPF